MYFAKAASTLRHTLSGARLERLTFAAPALSLRHPTSGARLERMIFAAPASTLRHPTFGACLERLIFAALASTLRHPTPGACLERLIFAAPALSLRIPTFGAYGFSLKHQKGMRPCGRIPSFVHVLRVVISPAPSCLGSRKCRPADGRGCWSCARPAGCRQGCWPKASSPLR